MIPHPLIEQLTRERRHRGWTQKEAAARAGLSVTSLEGWETGAMPTLRALQCYLDALGLRLIAVPPGVPTPAPAPESQQTKVCPDCQRTLLHRDFPRDRSRKDGLSWRCRACGAEKYQRSRARRQRSSTDPVESS